MNNPSFHPLNPLNNGAPGSFDPGTTLRDWFAGQALPDAWLLNREYSKISRTFSTASVARDAYEMADALLAERAKVRS